RFNIRIIPYNTSADIYSNTIILIIRYERRRVSILIVVAFLNIYNRYTIITSVHLYNNYNKFIDITIAIEKKANSSRYIEELVFNF
ncbi:hypothetical protein NEUTE2DRAFT_67098, partial [Neurospora tetrasperma FGSC 2509]